MASSVDSYIEQIIQKNTIKGQTCEKISQRLKHDVLLKELTKDKLKSIQDNNKKARNKIQLKIIKRVNEIRIVYLNSLNDTELFQLSKELTKGKSINTLPTKEQAEKLNIFFTRFNEYSEVSTTTHVSNTQLEVHASDICILFIRLKTKTSSGPSKIPAWLFMLCAKEMSEIYAKY